MQYIKLELSHTGDTPKRPHKTRPDTATNRKEPDMATGFNIHGIIHNSIHQGLADISAQMKAQESAENEGYICKRCHKPAPLGVGYISHDPAITYADSKDRTSCPCGYSQKI